MQETITEKQQEILFRRLCAREENSHCADCRAKGATWVSLGYGVFVCINCSGVHRSFGMHITRVRSTKLDSWIQADARIMEAVGNRVANLFWEAGLERPPSISRDDERMSFIKQKYQLKSYAKKQTIDPVAQLVKSNYALTTTDLLKSLGDEPKSAPAPIKKTQSTTQSEATRPPTQSAGVSKPPAPNHSKSEPKTHAAHDEDLLCFDVKPQAKEPVKQQSQQHDHHHNFSTADNFDFVFNQSSQSALNPNQNNHSHNQSHANVDEKIDHKTKSTDPFDFFQSDFIKHTPEMSKPNSKANSNGNDYTFDFTTFQDGKTSQTTFQNQSQNPTSQVYNINNVTIFNAPANVNLSQQQSGHNDKYAVLDVFKMHHASSNYKY